jgi:hypothetical protein
MAKSKKRKLKRIPYDSLTDDEKVRKNWNKTLGLYKRGEWSVTVLRCGTCLELAINFAVREELVEGRELPLKFVDKLLRNANGIHNKYHNIYLPIMEEYEEWDNLKDLWRDCVSKVNKERNAVAHRGEFRSRSVAIEVMENTYRALMKIMVLHGSEAKLKSFKT